MESSSANAGPDLRATIHIGASSVSMLIREPASGDEPGNQVEFLEKPLPLARDIFRRGRISRSTTEHAVEILFGFGESLREVGVDLDQVERAVATNILAEAENVEVFLNRLNIACGLHLEVLDDGEMTRLIYLKTRRRLKDTPSMKTCNTLVVHVGPGNTRILLFRKGRINRYTSYRLGAHRTGEAVEASHADGAALLRLIREQISGQISQIYFDFEHDDVEDIIVIGYELQLLTPYLTKGHNAKTTLKSLQEFVSEIAEITGEERVQRYQLDYHTADAVVPALETNLAIAEIFNLQSLRIPDSDYERGILGDLPRSPALTTGFQAEVIRSARILAQKFKVDAKHAGHVAKLVSRLFEETAELHQLTEHDALLLEVAAILHECGGYVSPRAHHKHSQYLIQNSEIFGLSRPDVLTVSLIARYHRRSGPKTRHADYRSLPGPERIRVSKMAAIMRVADALERAHSQRVRDFSVEITRNKIRLNLIGVTNAAVERLAMQSKGDLFHDVFGLEVVLSEQG
jgi:exopolyphosphatase/guanosine-5'-triphosphate,3'-diphosphate pyrophosphatase